MIYRQKKNTEQGFTLIELILSIALTSIIIGAASAFMIDIFKARSKSTTVLEVQQNVRFAMNKMNYSIRNSAGGINAGSSSFSPTDPGSIYLEMGAGAADDIVFDVSGGRLRMTVGGGSPEFLTTDEVEVTRLIFTNNTVTGSPRNVSIDLAIQFANPGNKKEFEYNYDAHTSVSVHTP